MSLAVVGDRFGIGHVRHWAARVGIGQQHHRLRRQQLGGFGHETHAAEDDHFSVHGFRLDAQFEGVSGEVGDILYFGPDIVVGEDHRMALLLEAFDFIGKR